MCIRDRSSTPKIVIQKNLGSTSDWWFYTTAIDGSYDYLKLNTTDSKSDYSESAPTSTVFSSHGWGATSMIGYCFHEVKGYSRFASYTGNGNADGPFIYTGFKPSFILFKTTNAATNWSIHDSTRDPFNPAKKGLFPSREIAESTGLDGGIDILSNGFKIRQTQGYGYNNSGAPILYMAFAEHPFNGDGGTAFATAR